MKSPSPPGSAPLPSRCRFGDLTLDFGQRRLDRGGEPIALGKLTYALLVALVEAAPDVLTHDELVLRVWGGRATSPETVTQRAKLLRDALQDDAERPRYVALVRGQGYKLIPRVEPLGAPSAVPAPEGASGTPVLGRRIAAFAAVAVILVLSAAAAYFTWPPANPSVDDPPGPGVLDFEVTQLTTTGKAIMPAISPDGGSVVYAELDADEVPRSLWVRQVKATGGWQVATVDPPHSLAAPTVSPDGRFIDYVKSTPGGPELWRVSFLPGGTPQRLRGPIVASPIGWSPDRVHGAFIRHDAYDNTTLVTFDEGGDERVLATRAVPRYFVALNIRGGPQIRPSWSPDGRLIALAEFADILAPRITFVDAATGAETSLDSQGSFTPQGLGWLGPSTLVVSQPGGFGQRVQLWKMAYPGGTVEPLTKDLASFMGVDLDASRTRLVTERHDVRASVSVGDASGRDAVEVVPPTPFSGESVFLSWAGERLLYDATLAGRPVIARLGSGSTIVVEDAFHVAASADGGTIVFSNATRGREGLWKVDTSGGPPIRLTSGFAVEPVVTRDGAVVFSSNREGVQSPWIVPIEGGHATEIVHRHLYQFDVSPDGRWLAMAAPRSAESAQRVFVVCELPRCANSRELATPPNFAGLLRWTPDGKELAYRAPPGNEIWAVPLDGSPPHALTSFGPNAKVIQRFAWSRDGQRLAFVNIDVEHDVVLLSGLLP